MRRSLLRAGALALGALLCTAWGAQAQPTGWTEIRGIDVTENSGVELTNYQLPLIFDTEKPINDGVMKADGADLRFGTATDGGTQLDYWIESGIGTTTTKIWVLLPSLPASSTTTIYMFFGKPSAAAVSSIAIFEGPHSGNGGVTGGSPGGSGDRQRGFHFVTLRDILVTKVGKYEPTGTTRYVTIFDRNTEAVVYQDQVSGAAATYSYEALTTPIWFPAEPDPGAKEDDPSYGHVITVHLATGDQYYISANTDVGPHLLYMRTRWCNTCDQDTFPTNATTGHFGYPDFEYYARAEVPTLEPSTLIFRLPPIFDDSFESEDTCGWSASVASNACL